MKRLHRFLRLPAAERRLLLKAALLLEAIKLGMRLLPLRLLRHLLSLAADTPIGARRADRLSAERIVWAVETASWHTPGAKSCLVKALTTQVLLARCGYPALLYIGADRGERDQFQAHAWVESDGLVIGGGEPGRYAPLAVFGSRESQEQKL